MSVETINYKTNLSIPGTEFKDSSNFKYEYRIGIDVKNRIQTIFVVKTTARSGTIAPGESSVVPVATRSFDKQRFSINTDNIKNNNFFLNEAESTLVLTKALNENSVVRRQISTTITDSNSRIETKDSNGETKSTKVSDVDLTETLKNATTNLAGGAVPVELAESVSDFNNLTIGPAKGAEPREKFYNKERLVYPENLDSTGQDYIIFDVIKYRQRNLSQRGISFDPRFPKALSTRELVQEVIGSAVLPLQSQISDSNRVNWKDGQIDITKLTAAGISGALQEGESVGSLLESIQAKIKEEGQQELSDATRRALTSYFSMRAANPSGNVDAFLSRISGATLNSNIEMLFNGPSLRSFSFMFRLTPRSQKEGLITKRIIRLFKEASAVQRGIADIFLKTPYVFNIRYKFKNSDHPKINRIKTSALRSVSVNYIPDGTYMSRPDGTMTSYDLLLEFTELEPIYADDYQNFEYNYNIKPDEIGF